MREKLGNPKNTIEVIQKYQFAFQKKFGQNFLIDPHVLDKIIGAAGVTKEDMVLEDFETWDSVAVLSVIAMMDEHFGKYPHASEIRSYVKVSDLMKNMEK